MKKLRLPLSILAIVLVAAAHQWSLVLEARLNYRLEHGVPLRLRIAPGTNGLARATPPLTDAFTVSVRDLNGFRSGFRDERWQVEQLKFRPSVAQAWKALPQKIWRSNWNFFRIRGGDSPRAGEQRNAFSIFGYSTQGELLVGQYQMRAHYNADFQDSRSGVSYLGAGIFQFDFHVPPAPQWKKRVILDAARKIERAKLNRRSGTSRAL